MGTSIIRNSKVASVLVYHNLPVYLAYQSVSNFNSNLRITEPGFCQGYVALKDLQPLNTEVNTSVIHFYRLCEFSFYPTCSVRLFVC